MDIDDLRAASLGPRPRFKDIQRKAPTKTTVQSDGTVVTEKLCPIPFHWKAVDPDGNVVTVPLANGTTHRTFRNNPYGETIRYEKPLAGFLWLHECPYRSGAVPLPKDNEQRKGKDKIVPCDGIDGHGRLISKGHEHKAKGCDHLRAIALARRAVKKKHNDRINERFMSDEKRLAREMRAQLAMSTPDPKAKGGMPF